MVQSQKYTNLKPKFDQTVYNNGRYQLHWDNVCPGKCLSTSFKLERSTIFKWVICPYNWQAVFTYTLILNDVFYKERLVNLLNLKT